MHHFHCPECNLTWSMSQEHYSVWRQYDFCPNCAHKKLRQFLEMEKAIDEWAYTGDNDAAMTALSKILYGGPYRQWTRSPQERRTPSARHTQPQLTAPEPKHSTRWAYLEARDRAGI